MRELVRILPTYVRARECPESPTGYRWVELFLEDQAGAFEINTAVDVLAALQLAAEVFARFRIVRGNQWLDVRIHQSSAGSDMAP